MGLLIHKDSKATTRVFNGKKYKTGGVLYNKREAESELYWYRTHGRRARMMKRKGGWVIFIEV